MGDHIRAHTCENQQMSMEWKDGGHKLYTNWWKERLRPLGPVCVLGHMDVWMEQMMVSDGMECGCGCGMGVGSDEEHSLTDSPGVMCSGPGKWECISV